MKRPIILTILLLTAGFLAAPAAGAMDERNAYEAGDGHWIYFGPAPTHDRSAQIRLPRKRSLEQSIRGDALRHYEMPRYELPESGQVIPFAPEDATAGTRVRATPPPAASPWEDYELPESGQIIYFPKNPSPPPAAEKTVADRQDDGTS